MASKEQYAALVDAYAGLMRCMVDNCFEEKRRFAKHQREMGSALFLPAVAKSPQSRKDAKSLPKKRREAENNYVVCMTDPSGGCRSSMIKVVEKLLPVLRAHEREFAASSDDPRNSPAGAGVRYGKNARPRLLRISRDIETLERIAERSTSFPTLFNRTSDRRAQTGRRPAALAFSRRDASGSSDRTPSMHRALSDHHAPANVERHPTCRRSRCVFYIILYIHKAARTHMRVKRHCVSQTS